MHFLTRARRTFCVIEERHHVFLDGFFGWARVSALREPRVKMFVCQALTSQIAKCLDGPFLDGRDRPNRCTVAINPPAKVRLRKCLPAIPNDGAEVLVGPRLADRQRPFDLQAEARRVAGWPLKINDDVV